MKRKTVSKMSCASNRSSIAPWMTLLLCALTMLIFTFKPFQFVTASRSWDFDFYPRDLLQNVIMFLPLGVLLRRSLALNFGMVILLGFLFSTGIECLQLFTPHRYSNPYDIACNTSGSVVGAWMADRVFGARPKERLVQFMVTLLLLCWVIGLGIKGEPVSRYAIYPFSAVGALLFYKNRSTAALKRWIVLAMWSALSIAFFFYSIRLHAVNTLALVLMVNVLLCCAPLDSRRLLDGLFSLGSAVVLIAVVLRLLLSPWNWDLSLRAMELLLLAHLYDLFRHRQSVKFFDRPDSSAATQAL